MSYYALLGVEATAETAAIRSAYHTLARIHHPDRSGGSSDAMVTLNEAWTVLRDATARATYDRDHGFSASGPEPAASATSARPASPPPVKATPDVLDFGRYEGWSLRDLAREDPDYLLWLERTSVGRRYRSAIDALLRQAPRPAARASRFSAAHAR